MSVSVLFILGHMREAGREGGHHGGTGDNCGHRSRHGILRLRLAGPNESLALLMRDGGATLFHCRLHTYGIVLQGHVGSDGADSGRNPRITVPTGAIRSGDRDERRRAGRCSGGPPETVSGTLSGRSVTIVRRQNLGLEVASIRREEIVTVKSLHGFLGDLLSLLEQAKIPYIVRGSIASTYYGRSRATQHVDLVIDPDP